MAGWLESRALLVQPPSPPPPAVQTSDPFVAKVLANHLSMGAMYSFVVLCLEDYHALKDLRKEVRGCPNFDIHVINQGGVDPYGPLSHPLGDSAKFRELGFIGTLDECFEAPMPVKHHLATSAGINRIYLSNRVLDVGRTFQSMPQGFQHYYDGDGSHKKTVSEYDGISSIRHQSYNDRRSTRAYLGVADAEVEGLKREVERADAQAAAARAALEQSGRDLTEVEAELRKVTDRRSQLTQATSGIASEERRLKARLDKAGRELENHRRMPEPLAQQGKLETERAKAARQLAKALKDLAETWAHKNALQVQSIAAEAARREVVGQLERLDEESRMAEERLGHLQEMVRQAKEVHEASTARAKGLKEAAQRQGELTAELEQQLGALPDTLLDLQQLRLRIEGDMNALVLRDPGVIAAYNDRCNRIAALDREIRDRQAQLDEARHQLDRKKQQWLPELQQVVSKVNETFSRNFGRVGCAGEVWLVGEEDRFETYRIEIRVKFRENEPLGVLTAARQSGGERSVSTMLYLIALQGVVVVPFRVVDEINQGMDATNERKIFDLLVDSAAQRGTPQCFLLTPKVRATCCTHCGGLGSMSTALHPWVSPGAARPSLHRVRHGAEHHERLPHRRRGQGIRDVHAHRHRPQEDGDRGRPRRGRACTLANDL